MSALSLLATVTDMEARLSEMRKQLAHSLSSSGPSYSHTLHSRPYSHPHTQPQPLTSSPLATTPHTYFAQGPGSHTTYGGSSSAPTAVRLQHPQPYTVPSARRHEAPSQGSGHFGPRPVRYETPTQGRPLGQYSWRHETHPQSGSLGSHPVRYETLSQSGMHPVRYETHSQSGPLGSHPVRYETVTLSSILQPQEIVTIRIQLRKGTENAEDTPNAELIATFDGGMLNVTKCEHVPSLVGVSVIKPGEVLYRFMEELHLAGHLKRTFTVAPWKLCSVVREGVKVSLEELRSQYLAAKP